MVMPLGDMEKTRIVPVATYLLIALNVLMYGVELVRGEAFRTAFSATPFEITHAFDIDRPFAFHVEPEPVDGPATPEDDVVIEQAPGPWPIQLTILTAMFLHASPIHLAGNMLFLWIFGDNVEEVLGTFRYLLVYLICGVAGTLAQLAATPDSLLPSLGASGAIAGLMGAYVVWFPRNRVRVLIFRFMTVMPAYLVVGLWIGLQVALGYGSISRMGEVGGVAYLAHLGGALAGLIVAIVYRRRAQDVMDQAQGQAWVVEQE